MTLTMIPVDADSRPHPMTPTLTLPEFPFTKTTLGNGLDVIVRREPRLPVVAVNLWYHVGSKDEAPRQRGFAHLFEHLMFEGSEHYPGDFFKPLQRLGAAVNGSTSSDRTNYFVDVPSAHAELAVAMESDRMANLLPALTDQKLRVQKDVVKNEYRQNYANRPYGMAWGLLAEALYPAGHPYRWLTIGVMEDVEAATRDDVEAFFRRYYVPANASLCLVGDLDEDRALALAERYFGTIHGGAGAVRPVAPEVRLAADVDLRLHDRVELDRVYLSWPTVPLFDPEDAPLSLLADVLARGRSSRLYRQLVMERQAAQDVHAYQSGRELAGSFGLTATLRPGHDAGEVRALVAAELESIARAGVEPHELRRVRNGRLSGFFYALESVGGFGGVADRLNAYNTYLGDPGRITSDFQRYETVTSDDIRDVAARFLDGRPRVSLTVEARRPAVTSAGPLNRSVAPQSTPARPFRAPVPEVRTLACGVPLWVLRHPGLPVVSGTVVLGGGGGVQPPGRPGIAQLTAAMLDEGTTTRSAAGLAAEAEGMGASLSTSCGWDGSYITMHCLSPYLGATLDLTADVLRNPTFPESEWSRIRGQALDSLRAERDSAESRAHRGLLQALYPPGHPYRAPLSGESGAVATLTRDDLAAFHRTHHGPSQAAWVVSGDVDPDELTRLLDERLAGWAGPHSGAGVPTRPDDHERPRILLLDRPGAVQAVVRVGHVGLHRHDADFTEALVLNHILGGQFTSRLNARLREEKGSTYGVRSHFDFRRGAGPFHVTSAVQSDRVAEALDDIRREISHLRGDRPPTPAELDDARRSLIEGQARHFETPSALVSRYASLFVHGLPLDHYTQFADRLHAVTTESLLATAVRQLHPDRLVAVVVADAAQVEEPLRNLGWAEVVVATE